jgi:hypothetical protein
MKIVFSDVNLITHHINQKSQSLAQGIGFFDGYFVYQATFILADFCFYPPVFLKIYTKLNFFSFFFE